MSRLWLSSRFSPVCCRCLKHARATPFRVRADPHSSFLFSSPLDQSSVHARVLSPRSKPIIFLPLYYLLHVMNVRKIIESYEQERSATVARPSPRTSAHRSRPRPRPRTESSPVAASHRHPRTQRLPNLKIVQEERPVTIVLKVR